MASWKPRATTVLTAVVVATTLLGGYVVAAAIDAAHAGDGRLLPITRPALVRSAGRVLDARLGTDRLQILLATKGAPTSASAAVLAQQQQLAKIAGIQMPAGAADALSSSGAGSYLAKAVSGAGALLARRLADLLSPDAVMALAPDRQADAASVERRVTALLTAHQADAVISTWRDELTGDAGLQKAWLLTEAPGTLDGFLREATAGVPFAIATQVAGDVLLTSVPAAEADARGVDLAARLAWGIAAVLFIGLWSAAVAVAVQQLFTLARHAWSASAAMLLAAAGVGSAVYKMRQFTPSSLEVLGPLLQMLEAQRHTHIVEVSRMLSALAAAAAVVLLAGAWAVLQDVPTTAAPDNSHEPALRLRLDGLRMIFNAGAALLVAGTVEIAMLYQWPAAVFGSGEELRTAAWLAGAFSGVLFSVILSLVYLPAVAVLRTAVRNTMSPSDAAALLDSKGFNDTAPQQIARILQALAPMLTAFPLSMLAGALSQ